MNRPAPNQAPPAAETRLTLLLHAWKGGDRAALEQVARKVHADLMRMAASRLRGSDQHTLTQGDLVNEAWMRLLQSPKIWNSREHFFATAALTIRSVLTDRARARLADKRGAAPLRMTLTESSVGEESMAADLLTLDALLRQLAEEDPRAANIVDLAYFGGLEREEIGEVLGISEPTVGRELRFARAWLGSRLGRDSLEG